MEQGEDEGRVCSHLDLENTGEGSVQHVDRIVPPTIDENYNRREATERFVQPGVGASSFLYSMGIIMPFQPVNKSKTMKSTMWREMQERHQQQRQWVTHLEEVWKSSIDG